MPMLVFGLNETVVENDERKLYGNESDCISVIKFAGGYKYE